MTKHKKEKILSGLIAFSFLFSNIVPISNTVAYAAEDQSVATQETADKQKENTDANMTDQDREIQKKVQGANNAQGTAVGTIAESRLQQLAKEKTASVLKAKQENQTSQTKSHSYYVYDSANNQNIVVTENLCYKKTTPECSIMQTLIRTNSDGKQETYQQPLNTLKYLSGSTVLTNEMLSQIRNQQISADAYNDPEGKSVSSYSDAMKQVYQTRNEVSGDMDSNVDFWAKSMAQAAAATNRANVEKYKEYNKAVETVAQARQDVTDQRAEEEQIKRNVITQDSTKRFKAKISPSIPLTGKGSAITLMLKTPSGEPQDTSKYTIRLSFKNMNTGKQETIDVLENTEYTLEEAVWDKKPGMRKVVVYYNFAGKGNSEQERYLITYNVGSMATSILPDGRNVKNGVSALVSNAPTIDYLNLDSQIGVAGRIIDTAYKDGMCLVQITDAKNDADIGKYKAVNVATSVASEEECTSDLIGKYANFQTVSAKKLADGSYVFMDTSEQGGTNLGWNEDAYNKYEDKIAEDTQNENINGNDVTALKVGEDGIIHQGLAGILNTDYVCFQANGSCVSIIKQEDGSAKIAKVDGSEYTQEELNRKGLPNLSTVYAGFDENGVAYVSDMSTGKSLTIKSFADIDKVAPASKKLYALNSLATPNLDMTSKGAYLGETKSRNEISLSNKIKASGERILGSVTSSFGTFVMGTNATSSITAPLNKINIKESPMTEVFKSHISSDSKASIAMRLIRNVQREFGYSSND